MLRETLEKMLPNLHERDTRIAVLLDDDDLTVPRFLAYGLDDPQLVVSVAPREESFGAKWNRAIRVAPADVYATTADYGPYLTPGSDTRVLEAAALFPDGIGAVYSHLCCQSFPSLQAVTAKLAEKMGGIFPGLFPYWFEDHWLDDIVRMIDRIAFCDVLVERHRRPGTQEQREPAFWAMVYDALMPERRALARRIIEGEDFREPTWRKQLLLGALPLHDERSLFINHYVRSLEGGDRTVDARYLRIKERAIQRLRGLEWGHMQESCHTGAVAVSLSPLSTKKQQEAHGADG